ncbi:B3 domain-containing protein [Tripterygium wilfordii]|uniref:B3 domain-containing protein n=1 Tax=Tripterygium wilfordii TaxID=458696 RepID=A0A7J7D815_TRIWF|nr:B3 domain-containing protein [Tripterygium wilfordii]
MKMEVKIVDTVRCIMEKIQETQEIPVSSQELLLKGEILDQENEICTYEFTQNCLIEVIKSQRVRTLSLELFIASIGGTDLQMLLEKRLVNSDVNSYRMLISRNAVKSIQFLTDEEKRKMSNRGRFDVKFIGPDFKICEIGFREGERNGYVLGSNWAKVRKTYGLKQGDTIQVWSFRESNGKLGLALLF